MPYLTAFTQPNKLFEPYIHSASCQLSKDRVHTLYQVQRGQIREILYKPHVCIGGCHPRMSVTSTFRCAKSIHTTSRQLSLPQSKGDGPSLSGHLKGIHPLFVPDWTFPAISHIRTYIHTDITCSHVYMWEYARLKHVITFTNSKIQNLFLSNPCIYLCIYLCFPEYAL